MKKILSLLLSLVVLIMLPAAAMAEVDLGGNLRVRYNLSETDDSDTFEFDRLAIKFSSSLSEFNGFKSEVQFRNPAKNKGDDTDIRVDKAYYYHKNVFGSDELNIGYIPISWHAAETITMYGSLGDDFMVDNSVGVKYTAKGDGFSITGNVANAANEKKNNDGVTGYDMGLRGTISPLEDLTVGVGVCKDVDDDKADNSTLRLVADALYSLGALGIYGEYVSIEETTDGESEDAESGLYLEGSFKMADNFTAYAGMTSAEDLLKTDDSNDRFVVGGKYKLAAGTTLQGEYVDVQDDDWEFSLRLRVDF